jgi:microcystin-dependent protein
MPTHTHTAQGDFDNNNATATSPNGAVPVNAKPIQTFSNPTGQTPQLALMNPAMVSVAGGSQPHNNMMPYLTLNYCIALQGVYPPRT